MKLIATVVIFALVCHLAIGDTTNSTSTNTTSTNNTSTNTTNTTNSTNTTTTNTTTPTTNTSTTTNTTNTSTTNTTTPPLVRLCNDTQFWNGTGCSQCPAGCGLCVTKNKQTSCTTCLSPSAFLQITNDLGSCVNCTANCTTCKGPLASDCIKPADGHSYNPITKTIVACKTANCEWCNADGTCGLCMYKFRLDNGSCTPCSMQGCASCPSSVSTCAKCLNGYSLNGTSNTSTCEKCPTGCENCKNGTCSLCAFGYDLVNGTCVQHTCTGNCAFCDSKQVCTQCNAGYFLNTSGNGTCTACGTHCTTCTSATQCTACAPNSDDNGFHYSLNNNTCNKCNDQNCKACDGSGNCTQCYDGYFVNDKKACAACTAGCASCTAGGCTQCRVGYKLLGSGNTSNCTAYTTCKSGEQIDASGACSAGTIDNCITGDATAKTCLKCGTGYFPDGSTCAPCPNGCQVCNKNSTGYLSCTAAFNGVGFSIISNPSAKVDSTGYLCRQGCSACDQNAICTACMPNHLFTQSLIHTGERFCLPYETCPHPVDGSSPIMCWSDLTNQTKDVNTAQPGTPGNGVKLAMSFIAVFVAALFVF